MVKCNRKKIVERIQRLLDAYKSKMNEITMYDYLVTYACSIPSLRISQHTMHAGSIKNVGPNALSDTLTRYKGQLCKMLWDNLLKKSMKIGGARIFCASFSPAPTSMVAAKQESDEMFRNLQCGCCKRV